jgi:hypothetical protein
MTSSPAEKTAAWPRVKKGSTMGTFPARSEYFPAPRVSGGLKTKYAVSIYRTRGAKNPPPKNVERGPSR